MGSKNPDDGQSELNRDKTTCRMSAIDAGDRYSRDCSECLHTANFVEKHHVAGAESSDLN